MGGRFAGLAPFSPLALAEYERCALIPGTSTSICEDYRASADVDLVHDREDLASGNRVVQPLRVIWGEHGSVGRCFDVLSLWRDRATTVSGMALPCGHYLAEELPEAVAAEALKFFN
jgi:haloacetate dehalogenase